MSAEVILKNSKGQVLLQLQVIDGGVTSWIAYEPWGLINDVHSAELREVLPEDDDARRISYQI